MASQMAKALESAHDKGIVHRDLKPANVKIASDGSIKVLDFGLAKLDEALKPPTEAPAIASDESQEGRILGTAAYMSPEQARGQPVDKRTDIWAFGCVLYEMLTGHAAFARETLSDTIAAILEREPEWTALPRSTPPTILRLLRRCLEKEAGARMQHLAAGSEAIRQALDELESKHPAIARTRGRTWAIAAAVGAGALAAVIALRTLAPPDDTLMPAACCDLLECGVATCPPPVHVRWECRRSRPFTRRADHCLRQRRSASASRGCRRTIY